VLDLHRTDQPHRAASCSLCQAIADLPSAPAPAPAATPRAPRPIAPAPTFADADLDAFEL